MSKSKELNATFNRFDLAFARFLQEKEPSPDARHAVLAALVSHLYMKGHTCLDLNLLSRGDWSSLSLEHETYNLLPKDLAQSAKTIPWKNGVNSPLVLDNQLLYLRKNWEAESRVIESIRNRLNTTIPVIPDLAQDLDQLFGSDEDLDQPDWQKLACAVATRGLFTLITGGPGTGKTTTVTKLISLLISHSLKQTPSSSLRIALCAPTGKAAARLGASVGDAIGALPEQFRFEIKENPITLHKLLQIRSDDASPELKPLLYDVIVIDEASMISLHLMDRLLASATQNTRLIFLGDQDQLASVEAGAVMGQLCLHAKNGNYSPTTLKWLMTLTTKDLSEWGGLGSQLSQQTVMLRRSYRVEGGGVIHQWAQTINRGSDEDLKSLRRNWSELKIWSTQSKDVIDRLDIKLFNDPSTKQFLNEVWRKYLDLVQTIQLDSSKDEHEQQQLAKSVLNAFAEFQVLCAVREGPWGVSHLNKVIAHLLGFHDEGWYVGRPVMITRNNYHLDLRNGDIGVCLIKNGELRIAFPVDGSSDGVFVRWIHPSRIDSVESVFAMTVHKSQGSEFNHVCLVLPERRAAVLTRELIYTGLTRAKKKITWVVPDEKELFKAVQTKLSRSGGLSCIHDS